MNRIADDDGVVSARVDGIHGAFDEGDGSFKDGGARFLHAVR